MHELLRALDADLRDFTEQQTVVVDWQTPAPGADAPRGAVADAPGAVPNALPELHAAARANFDAKAEALLGMLDTSPVEADGSGAGVGDTPPGDEQVAARLPAHARADAASEFRDGEGATVARAFVHDGHVVGLRRDGYRALRRLAEEMRRTDALRSLVRAEALDAFVFAWVHARVTGRAAGPMSDHVLAEVAARVGTFEVVLPLFRVELAEPVRVGRVTLRTVTAADFARWEAAGPATGGPEALARRAAVFFQERKRMQGFAAATLTVTGEHTYAVRLALDDAEDAAAMLRLFSPAMLSPRARSFCTVWGREGIDAPAYLTFDPARPQVDIGRFMETEQDFVWRLDGARVRLIREQALDGLVRALFEGTPSAFALEIRTALLLFSRHALRTHPVDKLLAILLPLEPFLLRNASEAITENIATRLALAVGASLEERKRIRTVAQAVYAMRSAYLHHRKPIEGDEALETLRAFMRYAWQFFIGLGLHATSRHQTRAEYLGALDDRRLAG